MCKKAAKKKGSIFLSGAENRQVPIEEINERLKDHDRRFAQSEYGRFYEKIFEEIEAERRRMKKLA